MILSPSFFKKEWPQRELDGLATKEVGGTKVILPVWLNLRFEDVAQYSPTLADRLAANAADGIEKVESELLAAITGRVVTPVTQAEGEVHEDLTSEDVAQPKRPTRDAAEAIAGPNSADVDAAELAHAIARDSDVVRLRTIIRRTRAHLTPSWLARIEDMNDGASGQRVQNEEIFEHCMAYIEPFESDILKIEEFGLALVEAEFTLGISELLRIIEDLLSISEKSWPGTSLRPATGAPALLALRLVLNWCAKASDIPSIDAMVPILTQSLVTPGESNETDKRCFVDRRDLFWPSAMLEFADLGVNYIYERSWSNPGVQVMFANDRDYNDALAVSLFVAKLVHDARNPDEGPLYPGFKLLDHASTAIERFLSRVASNERLLGDLAAISGDDARSFRLSWSERLARLNEAKLGHKYDIYRRWRPIRFDL